MEFTMGNLKPVETLTCECWVCIFDSLVVISVVERWSRRTTEQKTDDVTIFSAWIVSSHRLLWRQNSICSPCYLCKYSIRLHVSTFHNRNQISAMKYGQFTSYFAPILAMKYGQFMSYFAVGAKQYSTSRNSSWSRWCGIVAYPSRVSQQCYVYSFPCQVSNLYLYIMNLFCSMKF